MLQFNIKLCNIFLRSGDCQDRQFAILDAKNQLCSSSRYPKLVLIKADVKGNVLTLDAPGMEPMEVKLTPDGHVIVLLEILGMYVRLIEYMTQASIFSPPQLASSLLDSAAEAQAFKFQHVGLP